MPRTPQKRVARATPKAAKSNAPKAPADHDDDDEAPESGDGADTSSDGEGADEGEPIEIVGEPALEADADEDVDDVTAEIAKKVPASRVSGDSSASLARFDPMAAYLREVQRHPLLSPEETRELAVKFVETQDPQMAARLVTANLRLVVKIAYEYRRAYKNIMDLVQEGNIGLMQAVKRYDPYRGVKLSSYAACGFARTSCGSFSTTGVS